MPTLEEISSSAADTLFTAAINNPALAGSAAAVGATAVGTVLLVKTIYDNMNQVSPFNEVDLSRHADLKEAWKLNFPEKRYPNDWTLHNNKPSIHINLQQSGKILNDEAERIRQYCTYEHDTRATILHHIGELFISISKRNVLADMALRRTRYMVRHDGVDIMFYSELAHWFLNEAAELRPENPRTILAYQKLLAYCKIVHDTVFSNDKSESERNNPYSTLSSIIPILNGYVQKLNELRYSMTLNELINQLNNRILGIASVTLDILYLLINKVKSTTFLIDKFNNPQISNKKTKAIRDTQLAEWLKRGVDVVGLQHSKFKPSNVLSLEDHVKTHLNGEHPDDADFSAPTFKWGHRPFALEPDEANPDGQKKAKKYLLQIRNIHRLVVELYLIRQSGAQASTANEYFGKDWMYGNQGGKATLLEWMCSVSEVFSDVSNTFNEFWIEYYHVDLLSYIKRNHISLRTDEYKPLLHIEHKLSKFLFAFLEDGHQVITQMREHASHYADNSNKIENSKIPYIEGVLEHRRYRNKTETIDYRMALEELNQLKKKRACSPSIDEEVSSQKIIPAVSMSMRTKLNALMRFTKPKKMPHPPLNRLTETNLSSGTSNSATFRELESAQYNRLEFGATERSNNNSQPLSTDSSYSKLTVIPTNRPLITIVRCPKGLLSVLEAANKQLTDVPSALSNEDYKLCSKPKQFHSDLQKHIYTEFLEKNQSVVNGWWAFSWLQQIDPKKMNDFADLYARINRVFKLLYQPSDGVRIQPTPLESTLIELLLQEKITSAFKLHAFYNHSLQWQDPSLTITENTDEIDVTIDGLKINLLRQQIIQTLKDSMDAFDKKDQENSELKNKCDLLQADLDRKELVITEQRETIADQSRKLTEHVNKIEILTRRMKVMEQFILDLSVNGKTTLNPKMEAVESKSSNINAQDHKEGNHGLFSIKP